MNHLGELLSALLDRELTVDERAIAEQHLEECPACRAELDGLRDIRGALRDLPELEPPIPLSLRRRSSRWWGSVAAAAAAAAVVVVGLAVAPGAVPKLDLDDMAGQHTAREQVDPGISSLRGPVGGP